MKYRGEIDGLRTIAVVPVVLFHAGFSMFSGGFVGVDVFFVISGYLITSILLDELEAGKFSIINFYERRMRRILPALFFVMGACLIPALLWLTPLDYKNFSQSLIATSAFSSNLLFWSESGYFDTEAELKPLLHTWSLAVEEQYYIFFPVFLALLWKWRGQRLFFPIITIVSVLSLVAAEWCIRNSPAAGFYLLPSRAWELLLGAGIARFQHGNVRAQATALRDLAAFAGLAMILAAITLFDETTPFPGLSAVLPAVGTALIIQFTDEGGRARALLGARPLVFMGLLSYSTYLWHQPLLAFAHYRNVEPLGVGFALALCVASVGLAYISWRFVEAPFRSRAATSRRTIFLVSGVGTAAFMAVGLAGHFANGFPARMDAASLKIDPAMASFAKRGDG